MIYMSDNKWKLQTVLIPKKSFTLTEAKKWLKDNNLLVNFHGKPIDTEMNPNFYRARQGRNLKKDMIFSTKKTKDNI